MDAVQFGRRDDLGYRRPPVTASFANLRRRGLPEVLFVHAFLPEGATILDVDGFAAMIEEAYNPPRTLLVDPPDEHGSQRCRGVGNNGLWEWSVVSPGRRSGWRMTLAPERDGQRLAAIEATTMEHMREVVGDTLATFPINVRPAGRPPAENSVQLGPLDAMGYRRPPVTVSFDELSRRGLPRTLFVNALLPEGITVCDVDLFAAMIRQAHADSSLRFVRPDELGNDQCVGLGGSGIWEWGVVRAGKPIDGDRYASPHQGVCRILFAPEKDGKRACTVDLNGYPGHEPEDDSPITFTVRIRPVSLAALEQAAAAGEDPADVAEGVDYTLSWLAETSPAAAGLLRLLSFLPAEPIPLGNLLYTGQPPADLPGPQAAALIGPLLVSPAAAGEARRALHYNSLIRHAGTLEVAGFLGEEVHPLARTAIRAQLTAQESAHWRQAAAALVEAAAFAVDPRAPGWWGICAMLLPHARAMLEPTSDGMGRVAGCRGESGDYRSARDLYRQIADARAADDAYGPEHPRTLADRHQTARWTGMAGDAAAARDELAALRPVVERALGPEHPDTLAVRRELACWTGEAGDASGALDQCVALRPVVERVLGGEHLDALAVRRELARWVWEAGDEPDAGERFAAPRPPVRGHSPGLRPGGAELFRHKSPGAVGPERTKASAVHQFDLLCRLYERILGGDHPDTLAVWGSLISCTGGDAGNAGNAGNAAYCRDQCELLLQRRTRFLGPDHPDTLLTRHELARFTGRAGDAAGARDRFADLLPVVERKLGPEHPRTQAARTSLAYWTRRAAG